MDYVVGSVAALISGNVTPNRPKLVRRALTPIKHQPSPNVTPKSEFADDRSIFLSPSVQKKKAIVKKSPKRIFQNPDLNVTEDSEKNSSPKADKVKKHLKEDLESNDNINQTILKAEVLTKDIGSPQSANENIPKKKKKNLAPKSKNKLLEDLDDIKAIVKKSPKRIYQNADLDVTRDSDKNSSPKADKVKMHLKEDLESNDNINQTILKTEVLTKHMGSPQSAIENIPKKKKENLAPKTKNKLLEDLDDIKVNSPQSASEITPKKKKRNRTVLEDSQQLETEVTPKKKKIQQLAESDTNEVQNVDIKIKKKKIKHEKSELPESNVNDDLPEVNIQNKKKNRKKKKNITGLQTIKPEEIEGDKVNKKLQKKLKNKKAKSSMYVNPNAITSKDSDSEHESDDEIYSENEEANKEVLVTGPTEESSDDEDTVQKKPESKEKLDVVRTEDEIKRTLFVGNVPLTKKSKKEMKNIFNKYGPIETVRIRTIPVKDARVTPKVAVITNELHPDRTTVNVYIRFKNESSVKEALAENNRVVNGCHLRVTRSDATGAEHDPRCALFVGNVPFALEDDQLREKFEKCGKIDSVRIIRDKKTNAGKGFAYVNFESKDSIELALALTEEDLTIKNRILRVKRCTQAAQRQKNHGNQSNSFGKKVFQSHRNQGQKFESSQFQGRNQMNKTFGKKVFNPRQNQEQSQGAQRRLMNKRSNQDAGEGPAAKRSNLNQPQKDKKVRKEFVGMTAEKKRKKTFNKGQKKKRALSEILTKPKN